MKLKLLHMDKLINTNSMMLYTLTNGTLLQVKNSARYVAAGYRLTNEKQVIYSNGYSIALCNCY